MIPARDTLTSPRASTFARARTPARYANARAHEAEWVELQHLSPGDLADLGELSSPSGLNPGWSWAIVLSVSPSGPEASPPVGDCHPWATVEYLSPLGPGRVSAWQGVYVKRMTGDEIDGVDDGAERGAETDK